MAMQIHFSLRAKLVQCTHKVKHNCVGDFKSRSIFSENLIIFSRFSKPIVVTFYKMKIFYSYRWRIMVEWMDTQEYQFI